MKKLIWIVSFVLILGPSPSFSQEADYAYFAGLGSWGTFDGVGLIGMSAEVVQQGVGVEVFLGIGTNRVQGWGLWPRIYLEGETWQPFGELALIQLSETEISIDPDIGLRKNTFTWQFMGVGLGMVYAQKDRLLRASLGLGVTGGQCLVCGMLGYANLHIGFSF